LPLSCHCLASLLPLSWFSLATVLPLSCLSLASLLHLSCLSLASLLAFLLASLSVCKLLALLSSACSPSYDIASSSTCAFHLLATLPLMSAPASSNRPPLSLALTPALLSPARCGFQVPCFHSTRCGRSWRR
jgi:hypothetical protein